MLNVWRGEEFMGLTPPTYLYLVTPLVPVGACILLYGKYAVGKSPFTWHMAQSIATGQPFLGMMTSKASVAYIDVDTPWTMIQKRWREVDFTPEFVIVEGQAFDCLRFGSNLESYRQPYEALVQCRKQFDPKLVIVNTLMKTHDSIAKNPNLPKDVYNTWQRMFPDSALLFIHHDKKDSYGDDGPTEQQEDEMFSGYQEWINHCNVAIHLVKQQGDNFLLKQTKDQGSGKIEPMMIHLRDGFYLDPVVHSRFKQQIQRMVNESNESLARRIATASGVSMPIAQRMVDEMQTDK